MYSVSVIMPVYNNEKTLKRAIESILNQTVFDLELILINDGSKDSSAQICNAYAMKEPLLVEVIHQERMGLGPARNKGLAKSSGEYIYFADANNLFEQNMLAENIQLAKEKEAELIVFGFTKENRKNSEERRKIQYLPRLPHMLNREKFRNHYRNFHHFYPYQLSNKIYRRDYLKKNQVKFLYSDTNVAPIFNLAVFRELDKVAFNRISYCTYGKIENEENSQYDETLYEMNMELAKKFESMINDWSCEKEFYDLIVNEYYKAIYLELENISRQGHTLTPSAQVRKINTILTDKKVMKYLKEVKISDQPTPYEKALLATLQKGNGKAAVQLATGKNGTRKAALRISRLFKKIFKK